MPKELMVGYDNFATRIIAVLCVNSEVDLVPKSSKTRHFGSYSPSSPVDSRWIATGIEIKNLVAVKLVDYVQLKFYKPCSILL